MITFQRAIELITHPAEGLTAFVEHGYFDKMKDASYLKLHYLLSMGKRLHLENPKSFNEKLQWLKLYDRRPEYTMMVDKYAVKQYVAKLIGSEYVIPTIGVWDHVEDIDFASLPQQFVLKTNHSGGSTGVIICRDKSNFDFANAKAKLQKSLDTDYYLRTREWPYKDVPRKIIAEKYMVDESGYELKDYKFFCFDGKAKALFIATDRGLDTHFDFYSSTFEHLPFTNGHPNADHPIEKPKNFEEMIALAEKMSQGIPQVRVDFYDIDGQVYFGEFTFFHWSGLVPFNPSKWDKILGNWIALPSPYPTQKK